MGGRRDGFEQGPWIIERGSASRGGASCNLSERILRVPDGADETSRMVRAHELMHIRISPHHRDHSPVDDEIAPRALECAEEFRVNLLLSRMGFDVVLLCDGTEKSGGQRLAENMQWGETICFYLAVLGTGAESPFVRGVRSRQGAWPAALRAIKKRVESIVGCMDLSQLGDTNLNDFQVPQGFALVTVPIARLLSRSMGARAPDSPESLSVFRRSLEAGSRRAPSSVFAPLVFDETMRYVTRSGRHFQPQVRPSVTGTTMRYPNRLLTDPLQRAFALKSRSSGGVIVIDQSGSMDVTVAEIEEMLACAPGAIIVGYSHRPGDHGTTPNAWILAKHGSVAIEPRAGNIGNGVDGPVLRWALARSHSRVPVVWVTDGQVTDSHDHPCHSLSVECASLVYQHGIRLVRSLSEVETALRVKQVRRSGFGRVGKELEVLFKG
ncbi:MAG: hypothetical protein HKL85_07120 [Acidimicrobiaceae bacterium]|nr:hypothetical protein [Acidimicrobiaceae bacterium]